MQSAPDDISSEYLTRVRTSIDALAGPCERIVVAVSGGVDSVALAAALRSVREPESLKIAHFDHRLRENSHLDADFVRKLAQRIGIQFELGTSSTERAAGLSVEEWARNSRYHFLNQTAVGWNAKFVATAHTANDQVETSLFNLLRGTGLRGLAGMRACRALSPHVSLIRPLLAFRRSENEAYLQAMQLSVIEDPSNQSDLFTRNRIRRELLPMIREQYNPKIDDALLRLAEQAGQCAEFVQQQASALFDAAIVSQVEDEVLLRCDPLAVANELVAGQMLIEVYERQKWPRGEIGASEIARILSLCKSSKSSGASIELPGGVTVRKIVQAATMLCLTFRSGTKFKSKGSWE